MSLSDSTQYKNLSMILMIWGLSMLLQMAFILFFLLLNNITLYICTTSPYPYRCWWTFRLLPCLAWRRRWHPTLVLLPGEPRGWRSLVGCSPWGHRELDMAEQLHFHFSLSCIGEGNGNPLQCSCLENPRDGRAWWAAISGVAQSWTRLKWLSSSSTFGYCK